jgi:hypothetical protein
VLQEETRVRTHEPWNALKQLDLQAQLFERRALELRELKVSHGLVPRL